jgi:ferric-dicitrate binding protein FerR (iron transport regulator)
MIPACFKAGLLLERRASGLDAIEGLRLEEHLASCTRCRAQANLLQGLAQLSAAEAPILSAGARERAINTALTADSGAHRSPDAASPWGLLSAAAALAAPPRRLPWLLSAAAACILLAVFLAQYTRAPSARVVSGRVQVSGAELAAGASLREQTDLHTDQGAVLAVAHANVELRARTDARWYGSTRTLTLQRGSLLIEVDPKQHRSFSVDTAAFHVEVLGTRFEVTETSVRVHHGRVSVTHRNQTTVLAAGSALETFELPPSPDATRAPDSSESTDAGRGSAETEASTTRSPEPSSAAMSPKKQGDERASALLTLARAQLAARDPMQARRTLAQAAPKLRENTQRAEALSLEAECDVMERRYSAARDAYLRVARKFRKLPAAETALFAAARIEAEHGEPARARQLLTTYLTRYPSGSYLAEAERRLAHLDPEPAQ